MTNKTLFIALKSTWIHVDQNIEFFSYAPIG